jgi:hypothetical protein
LRAAVALVITVVVPTMVGMRWFGGDAVTRLGFGGLVGIVLAGVGAMIAGLLGVPAAPISGPIAGLVIGGLIGPRVRLDVGRLPPLADEHRRLLLLVLVIGVALALLALARPVAGWDGWAIWSLKAKAFAATGGFAGPVFTDPVYAYAHADYPPLLSAVQGALYRLAGSTDAGWPLQVHLVWWWACGVLALTGFARRRGTAALLLLLSWAVAPHLVRQVISGYADVPMAMLLLCGAALLSQMSPARWAPAALLLAGAGLTKNEGLLLALAVVAAVAVWHPERRRAAAGAAAATVVVFAPWAAFVWLGEISNDVVAGLTAQPPVALDILARLPVAFAAVLREVVWAPRWGFLVLACSIVLVWAGARARGLLVAALAGLMLFVAIYAITPRDFDWHVEGSIDRVVTAPLGLLALAAACSVGRGLPSRTGSTAVPSPPPAREGSVGT